MNNVTKIKYTRLEVASIQGLKVWIARREDYGSLNVASSINLLSPTQEDMEQAIENAEKDNFQHIICYELDNSEFIARQHYYVGRE
jgi:hypothetical protein